MGFVGAELCSIKGRNRPSFVSKILRKREVMKFTYRVKATVHSKFTIIVIDGNASALSVKFMK